MKHEINITAILLVMFFITQIIGLVVINAYTPSQIQEQTLNGTTIIKNAGAGNVTIPFGMQPPEDVTPEVSFSSILLAMVFAVLLFLLLTKLKAVIVIKTWFFFVVFITLSISLTALLSIIFPSLGAILVSGEFSVTQASLLALVIALPLAFYKIIKRNLIVHNLTELLIYPGLAAIFVPILNVFWGIALLVAIAFYDMYAVWHSKIMVKMAKYQIQNLKIFTGFFLPYLGKKAALKVKAFKAQSKTKKLKSVNDVRKLSKKEKAKLKKIKVSLAMLGGGDVAFPLIFAGVVLRAHSLAHASIIVVASTLSLLFLFTIAKRHKFYPAMPFLSAGCIIGYLLSLLI